MADETTFREGGCACGQVRYRVAGEPIMVHNCHCRQCQQQTGSTSVVNGFWESDAVEITGELAENTIPGGSGDAHVMRRCIRCGVAVFSHYGRLGRLLTAVRAGSLDEPGSITPDVVIFTSEKMPWVALPEGIPTFATFYDFREELPAERVDRLRDLSIRRKAGEG